MRFLPSTVMIMIIAPIAGRLADRIGPRPLMTGGLITVSIALLWMTGITTHSSYGFLIVSFVLMGIGMGFVMSPMSTAAMNAVDPAKAGVASGMLSMTPDGRRHVRRRGDRRDHRHARPQPPDDAAATPAQR